MTRVEMAPPVQLGGAAPSRARWGLVLVHGRGASADDILGLGEALGLPDLALAAPEAPGRSWWPTSFLAPADQMEPSVARGLDAIETAIRALVEGGLAQDRIALAGFSQGGCLALEYTARRGELPATFGLSAGLVGTADAGGASGPDLYGFAPKRFDYPTDLTGQSVRISVHTEDPHIPLARAEESASVMRSLGADVSFDATPGPGHGITEADIIALRAVLNRP